MSNPSVIIIGAGAAGLIAARDLSRDFEVTVLEAQSHIGGRIHTIIRDGEIIEAGAEFVHGNLPVTLGLLKEAGIDYEKVSGKMYRKKNGHFTNVGEMTKGWNELLEKMEIVKEDMTMQEFLDKHYPVPENDVLRKEVGSYAEGFDLADIAKASVQALGREWNSEGEDNYRIPAGYSALARHLQKKAQMNGVTILSGVCVKEVRWQNGKVAVYVSDKKKYEAAKLLVTVPVSVLHQSASKAHIHFDPPLYFSGNVAAEIGFGAVIKIVLKFKKVFWQKDAGFIFSEELFPTWWTRLPDDTPVLTGWMGGPKATAHSDATDNEITEAALVSLAAIFDTTVSELKNELVHCMVFNWQANQYVLGAYSYATVYTEAAKKLVGTPLANTIFFAGEALYSGHHPGTVEAALVSGIDAATFIKNGAGYP